MPNLTLEPLHPEKSLVAITGPICRRAGLERPEPCPRSHTGGC